MDSYLINSFRGGISDENDKGIAGAFKYGYGLDIHKTQDSLSCKQAMKTGTAAMTGLARFFVKGNDGSTYCFCSDGKIYSRNGTGTYTLKYTDTNGAIKGAELWGDSSNNYYLFWATATSLARKLLPGNDAWSDVSKDWRTNLSNVDWHTMKAAAGALMIANGKLLAMVGYDMSYTYNALDVIPGNYVKAIDEFDDFAVLGSTRSDSLEFGYLWSWQTANLAWTQKKQIPALGINAIISAEMRLMQAGQDGGLYTSDFVNMIPLHQIPGGGYCNPGGVDLEDGLSIFGIYGGTYTGLWSFGRTLRNRPQVLNCAYRLVQTIAGSTVSEIGAVKNIGGTLLASWKTTDGTTLTYGVDETDSANKATAAYQGLEFSNNQPTVKKTFHCAKVSMVALPASCRVYLYYKPDKGSWTPAYTVGGDAYFSTTGATEAIFKLNDVQCKIIEIYLLLVPSANNTPEILAIDCEMYPNKEKY